MRPSKGFERQATLRQNVATICYQSTDSRQNLTRKKRQFAKTTIHFSFRQSDNCTVDVAKEAVTLVLELTVPVGEKEIVLTEEVFESVTALLNREKDARAEYGDHHDLYNHAAEISDEDVDEMEEQYAWTQSHFVLRDEEGKFVVDSDWTCSFCYYKFFGSFRCTFIRLSQSFPNLRKYCFSLFRKRLLLPEVHNYQKSTPNLI